MFNRILPYTTPAQPTPEELASGRNSFWRAIALWTLAILFIAAVSKSRALSVVGNFSGSAVSIGIALVWLLIFLGSVLGMIDGYQATRYPNQRLALAGFILSSLLATATAVVGLLFLMMLMF